MKMMKMMKMMMMMMMMMMIKPWDVNLHWMSMFIGKNHDDKLMGLTMYANLGKETQLGEFSFEQNPA